MAPDEIRSPETKRRLALDPNSAPDLLCQLLATNADDVLNNPAFALLWLEHPNVWDDLVRNHEPSALGLAQSPRVPMTFVEHCQRAKVTGPAWQALLVNQAIPQAVRQDLFLSRPSTPLPPSDWPLAVGERLALLLLRVGAQQDQRFESVLAADVTQSELDEAATLGWLGLAAAVRHPTCPTEALVRAVEATTYSPRGDALSNPGLPLACMERFVEDPTASNRSALARNPAAPAALLRRLAKDVKEAVKAAVADNRSIPPDVALSLARRSRTDIRRRLARSLHVPVEVLRLLAKDPFEGVRLTLAGNPLVPADVLEALAGDRSAHVREDVATHPGTPDAVLAQLAEDKIRKVAQAAQRTQDGRPCGSTS
jgi:hypothetical protein